MHRSCSKGVVTSATMIQMLHVMPSHRSAELSGLGITICHRGFTGFSRDDYIAWKKEGRLVNDGVNAKVRIFAGHGFA